MYVCGISYRCPCIEHMQCCDVRRCRYICGNAGVYVIASYGGKRGGLQLHGENWVLAVTRHIHASRAFSGYSI